MAARRKVAVKAEGAWADVSAASEAAHAPEPTVASMLAEEPKLTDFVGWLDRHGQKLEPGQRALARVMFDRVDPADLSGEEQVRALRMFGCDRVLPSARVLGVLMAVCGGRGGKSMMAAWRLVHLAASLTLTLSPGEQAYAIIVAKDTRLAEQTLRYCIGIAKEWFPGDGRVTEESSQGFTLVRAKSDTSKPGARGGKWTDERVRFAVLPASQGGSSLRGRALVGAIFDEAAFFRGDDSAINDKDLIDAAKPRIMVGGELIIVTTPWAKAGEVWELYKRNHGHPLDAVVAHAPTWELRTDEKILTQVEIEKTRDPWNHAREFGAVFMDRGGGSFFDPGDLDACMAVSP